MKVLGEYLITYPFYKVTQSKFLISHDDYVNDVKPIYAEITRLEGLSTNSKSNIKKAKELSAYIKREYGSEFFHDQTPLWLSQFNNGIMFLSEYQGGNIEVIIQKYERNKFYFIANSDGIIHSTKCLHTHVSETNRFVQVLGEPDSNDTESFEVIDECDKYKQLADLFKQLNTNVENKYFCLNCGLREDLIELHYKEIGEQSNDCEQLIVLDNEKKEFHYSEYTSETLEKYKLK